jgi:hypothetical protein
MEHQPAARDREIEPGLVFGRTGLVLKKHRRIDQFDVGAARFLVSCPGAALSQASPIARPTIGPSRSSWYADTRPPVITVLITPSAAAAPQPCERAKALAPLFDADRSAREIARILNDRNVGTPTGKPWSAMTVIRARDRLAAAA